MNKIEIYSTASNSRDVGIDIVDAKTGKGWILSRGSLQCNSSDEKRRLEILAQFPEAIAALRELVEIVTGGEREVNLEDFDRAKAILAIIDQPLN